MEKPTLETVRASLASPPRRVLSSRTDSDEGAAAACPPHRTASHYHRELHLVVAGERFFSIGDKVFRVQAGDVLFIDRWEEHGSCPVPGMAEAPYACAVMHGHTPIWWNAVIERPDGTPELIDGATYVILTEEVSAFFSRHFEAALGCPDAAAAAVGLRTATISAVAEYAIAVGRAANDVRAPLPVDMVRKRIADTSGAHCTVKGLAALAGLTPQTLDRKFRAAFGRSVRDEIQRVREAHLRFAIVSGQTQKEIASSLGFTAVSNYCRWRRTREQRSSRLEDIVRTYIDHCHGANCSLAALAARFGYSASRLAHIYRERAGEAVGDAVRRARLEFLRAHPALSDAEMAKALGFRSVAAYRGFAAYWNP